MPGQGASDVPLGIWALLDTVMKMTAFRPQILAAIISASVCSIVFGYFGWRMGATEILTALIGGLFGFLGGVSLRIIDSGTDEDKE